jgi:hypothetical protein
MEGYEMVILGATPVGGATVRARGNWLAIRGSPHRAQFHQQITGADFRQLDEVPREHGGVALYRGETNCEGSERGSMASFELGDVTPKAAHVVYHTSAGRSSIRGRGTSLFSGAIL